MKWKRKMVVSTSNLTSLCSYNTTYTFIVDYAMYVEDYSKFNFSIFKK